MSSRTRRKIIRLLGVGFDNEDGHVRITNGEKYDVLLGSGESHEYMLKLIGKIEYELDKRGMDLEELSPEELGEMIKSLT